MTITKDDIEILTLPEKQKLLEMLWDSMEDENSYTVYDNEPDETEEEIKLLEERLAEYEKDPSIGIPWEVAFERHRKKSDNPPCNLPTARFPI